MTQKKKNNIIIGSLCAVVLLMAVGYAAFSSILNIKGTSSISSNWKVLITNVVSKNIVGSASNKEEPSWEDLTATFKTNLVSPGDSIEYDITIENRGNLNAKLDKITLTDSNNEAIKFTSSGLEEGTELNVGENATLTVKVEYDNNITSQPENTEGTFTVTLDYSQKDEIETPEPTPFTGIVYSRVVSTKALKNGSDISGAEIFDNPSELGNYYLKHEIEDNKVTASYVCFITASEQCMRGGADYYEINKALLQSQGSWFTANGGSIHNNSSDFTLVGGGYDSVYVLSNGVVRAGSSSKSYCYVDAKSNAYCVNEI